MRRCQLASVDFNFINQVFVCVCLTTIFATRIESIQVAQRKLANRGEEKKSQPHRTYITLQCDGQVRQAHGYSHKRVRTHNL